MHGFTVNNDVFYKYLKCQEPIGILKQIALREEAFERIVMETGILTLNFVRVSDDEQFFVLYEYDPDWPRRFSLGKEAYEEIPDIRAKYEKLLRILGIEPGRKVEVRKFDPNN